MSTEIRARDCNTARGCCVGRVCVGTAWPSCREGASPTMDAIGETQDNESQGCEKPAEVAQGGCPNGDPTGEVMQHPNSSPRAASAFLATAAREMEATLKDGQPQGLADEPLDRRSSTVEFNLRHSLATNFKLLHVQPEDIANTTYRKVIITPGAAGVSEDEAHAGSLLRQGILLREKYLYAPQRAPWETTAKEPRCHEHTTFFSAHYHPFLAPGFKGSDHVCQWQDGVLYVYENSRELLRRKPLFTSIRWDEYVKDLDTLVKIINDPSNRSVCHKRLTLLLEQFNMFLILNEEAEKLEQISVPHRDFYNVRKVDTHVHHSSCMNQKHLLRFIKNKLKTCPDDNVLEAKDGTIWTLKGTFEKLNLSAYELSVDTLNVHSDSSIFQRFDRFNSKYNPCGQSELREIFLKTENYIGGRYLAEITKQVVDDLTETKYQHAEYRISIYGKKMDEWTNLAQWFMENRIYSDNVRWLVQIPRLFQVYKKLGFLNSFQDMLDNIFLPLFEVTIHPELDPNLDTFLQQLVGFDSVDDESVPQLKTALESLGPPTEWTAEDNPPYAYYSFFIYSNLFVLNKLRESRGMNTFTYRPHAGEAGDPEHLAVCFLLAHGINHGLNLRKMPVLHYLFYLTQVGIAMSPLSNNGLFIEYNKNPLPTYHRQGLNISLSSDDPLQFHFTREPLMEEYAVAAQVYKLSGSDLCELARNSVLQSGFEHCVKMAWLNDGYYKRGMPGNDISRTNVPKIRVRYRLETLLNELKFVYNNDLPRDLRVLACHPMYE
ncbi:AMP deaminase [Porphyridium purpureum]|uniref:AMP deaminase n=1 Tax=Porphyridium purpureum TaxID=35688 RepID=A0A5J4Z512_PORPP|nr:AMP deaminase [Porphyridium purpureum]|eukprot:POR9096..scf295_1